MRRGLYRQMAPRSLRLEETLMSDDLVIRGTAEDLEELRRLIETDVGAKARLHPVTSAQSGELREPVLIALIVALGGPAVTHAIAGALKQYLQHKETMAGHANERLGLENEFHLQLAIQANGQERFITLAELTLSQP